MNTTLTPHQIGEQLQILPPVQRLEVMETALRHATPSELKTLRRLLLRVEHPDVPEDVWEGFEECEDGKAIDIRDEHFEHPPV